MERNTHTIDNPSEFAKMIRRKRLALGLTQGQAASWCNVGTRLFFDIENAKTSVQFGKILLVAARMGLPLCVPAAPSAVAAPDQPVAPVALDLSAPAFDAGHWLGARAIAYAAARQCDLPVCDQFFDQAAERVTMYCSAAARPLLGQPGMPILREEQGGPGLPEVFTAIASQSTCPVADLRLALRWVMFTYLIGDTNISAADFTMDAPARARLAPFPVAACAPSLIADEPAHRGMRIGAEWPSEWLRLDQWSKLADDAHVKRQAVLEMMQQMATTVPGAITAAATRHYRTPVPRGAGATMLDTVGARATRMNDLLLSAKHQRAVGAATRRASAASTGGERAPTAP